MKAGVVSFLLWTTSWLHFVAGGCLLLGASFLLGARRADPLVRLFSRNVVRLAGMRLRVRFPVGFEAGRACFLVSNHVNKFDPFVLCGAWPGTLRGLELESHFRVPVYGWIMRRFGNVPVPDGRTPAALKRTYRLARAALDAGISLVVFPEGSRTEDGDVGPFEDGVFRMARRLKVPLVPVTLAGAWERKKKGDSRLTPGPVTVFVHDCIEPEALSARPPSEVRDAVRRTIRGGLGRGP